MIKIRINPAALEEFQHSEHGSYEDHGSPDVGHVWNILQRHTGLIEVRSDAEAAEVFYAVCSGTFQLDAPEEGKVYFRTACRIADKLREAARRSDPEMVARWKAPSGY